MTRSIQQANHLAVSKTGLAGDVFGELLDSLAGTKKFDLNKLYELNHADFTLAMELIADWRLHRYCYHPKHSQPGLDSDAQPHQSHAPSAAAAYSS